MDDLDEDQKDCEKQLENDDADLESNVMLQDSAIDLDEFTKDEPFKTKDFTDLPVLRTVTETIEPMDVDLVESDIQVPENLPVLTEIPVTKEDTSRIEVTQTPNDIVAPKLPEKSDLNGAVKVMEEIAIESETEAVVKLASTAQEQSEASSEIISTAKSPNIVENELPITIDDDDIEMIEEAPSNTTKDSSLAEKVSESLPQAMDLTEDKDEIIADDDSVSFVEPLPVNNVPSKNPSPATDEATNAPLIETASTPLSSNTVNLSDAVQNLSSPKPADDDSMQSDDNLVIDEPEKVSKFAEPSTSAKHENETSMIKGNCMNNQCAATVGLDVAPLFICNFYGHNLKAKKKYFICQKCYEHSVKEYEAYCTALSSGKPLLQMEFPVSKYYPH